MLLSKSMRGMDKKGVFIAGWLTTARNSSTLALPLHVFPPQEQEQS
jgi:hypothetical protein